MFVKINKGLVLGSDTFPAGSIFVDPPPQLMGELMQGGNALVVGPALKTNSVTAATENTIALRALADLVRTDPEIASATITYPAGDIHYNGVIDWVIPANQVASSILAIPEGRAHLSRSVGNTNFVWSGGQINGATWQYSSVADGSFGSRLRFQGLTWVGPGLQVTRRTNAGSQLTGGNGQVTLNNGAGIAVGDAICLEQDDRGAVYYTPIRRPWWATVTAVDGDLVSFLPATVAGFRHAPGAVVQIWKQSRAVQIGGNNAALQNFFFMTSFQDCNFVNWFSGLGTNDLTTLQMRQCVYNFCRFGLELGYNMDSWLLEQVNHECQVNERNGTVTSGSRVISGLSTADLRVGMSLGDVTAPATAQAFPFWAAIESIDSDTQVTMTHAATLGAPSVRLLQPAMGSMVAQGYGQSPWSPRSVPAYDRSRSNSDAGRIVSALGNHLHELFASDWNDNSSVVIEDPYAELCQRVASLGITQVSSGAPFVYRRGVISGAAKLLGPPVEMSGGGINADFSGVTADAPLPGHAFVACDGGSNARSWTWRQMNVATLGTALVYPSKSYFNGIQSIPVNADCVIDINGTQQSNLSYAANNVSGSWNQELAHLDAFTMTLTGNTTLNNQPWGTPTVGKRFRLLAIQGGSGGYTLALGTNFVGASGSAIGTIAAGALGRVCVMDFIGAPAASGSRWVLTGGAASFVALA